MGHEKVSKRILAGVVAAAAVGAVPVANADIELGAGFSVSGFADMSYWSSNPNGTAPTSKGLGLDQFETDFKYAGSGGVSAQVDVEYGATWDGSEGDTTFVEQAFITKTFTDQFSVKVGRFLSYSGWEAEEPTGLFQYSSVAAYAPYEQLFYGYYQQGLSAKYDGGKFAVTASVVDNVFDPPSFEGGSNGVGKLGYELGLAVMPVEGLTAKLFYMTDEDSSSGDKDVVNFWASYAVAGFTFAGEYNDASFKNAGVKDEADGYLLMVNYASGPFGITGRYHHTKYDPAGVTPSTKYKGFTVSPSAKVGDNLLLVAEFRTDKVTGGSKANSIGLEALFSF